MNSIINSLNNLEKCLITLDNLTNKLNNVTLCNIENESELECKINNLNIDALYTLINSNNLSHVKASIRFIIIVIKLIYSKKLKTYSLNINNNFIQSIYIINWFPYKLQDIILDEANIKNNLYYRIIKENVLELIYSSFSKQQNLKYNVLTWPFIPEVNHMFEQNKVHLNTNIDIRYCLVAYGFSNIHSDINVKQKIEVLDEINFYIENKIKDYIFNKNNILNHYKTETIKQPNNKIKKRVIKDKLYSKSIDIYSGKSFNITEDSNINSFKTDSDNVFNKDLKNNKKKLNNNNNLCLKSSEKDIININNTIGKNISPKLTETKKFNLNYINNANKIKKITGKK